MGAFKWSLFFGCLCFNVIQTEASSWTVKVPSSVKGLPGSCLVIPCSYKYPDPEKKVTEFTGIWTNATGHVIYHKVSSNIIPAYQKRTELVGDITQKNCSLKIDPLQQSDQGPFYFRIEIGGYNKYSYKGNTVTITMNGDPHPTVSLKEDVVVEGQTVSASCSVFHSCPSSPPDVTWNHGGENHLRTQQLSGGQWKVTSTLTFHPTKDDRGQSLLCTVRHQGGIQQEKASSVLKVKYAPVNVKVDYMSHVKEGEAVQLKCSSEANPSANTYQWYNNETGAQLHQGGVFKLENVSRHTGALYCKASNAVGHSNSSLVQLNVLFAPEIKTMSCSSVGDLVKCVCLVESRPPSMVHIVLSDRVLPNTKIEKHGYITIGSLQAEFGSSKVVQCLANNTLGNVSITVSLPFNGKNLYIFIAAGAALGLVILLITITVVKRRKGGSENAATSQMSGIVAEKAVELPQCATIKSTEMDYEDVQYPGIYSNYHVYGNMETDGDEAIYANIQ